MRILSQLVTISLFFIGHFVWAAIHAQEIVRDASKYKEDATKLCNFLRYDSNQLNDEKYVEFSSAIGAVFARIPHDTDADPTFVSSALLISESRILTAAHTMPYLRAIDGRVVLFGCSNRQEVAGDLAAELALYKVIDTDLMSSPKEHLDYALMKVAVLYKGEKNTTTGFTKLGCDPVIGENVAIAGYGQRDLEDKPPAAFRLSILAERDRKILRVERFQKTAGNALYIDYRAQEILDGFSGGAVISSDGCLLGMHHRRFSKIRDVYKTRWDTYVSLRYPHCRLRNNTEIEDSVTLWSDDCLPAQSNWIGDIALEAVKRNCIAVHVEIPKFYDLAAELGGAKVRTPRSNQAGGASEVAAQHAIAKVDCESNRIREAEAQIGSSTGAPSTNSGNSQ